MRENVQLIIVYSLFEVQQRKAPQLSSTKKHNQSMAYVWFSRFVFVEQCRTEKTELQTLSVEENQQTRRSIVIEANSS